MAELIKLGNFLEYLGEIFPEARSTLRILALFLKNPEETFTRYRVEKEALVSHARPILQRFVSLGILEIVDENPISYRLNKNSYVLRQMLDLLV